MRFAEFVERYVYVRKCVCCGERLGYEHKNEAFCNACRIAWERAKADFCPECSMSMCECRCIPKPLSKVGFLDYRKLVAYRKSRANQPENKIIYFLKHRKSKRVAAFSANQLIYKIDELISDNDENKKNMVLTYIPRSKKSYAKYGVDQAKLVCEAVSKISGIPCVPIIKRKDGTRTEQKKLNVKRRMLNVKDLFELNEDIELDVSDLSVIIFDDVVTSGASMASAVKILRKCKIKKIYALSLAYTVKEKS